MGEFLSRDDILATQDVTTEEVPVPEWGGSVLVRGLTGKQRDEFEATLVERRGKKTIPNTANFRARLVVMCCVDQAGRRIFTPADVEKVGNKPAVALERVFKAAARLSGMSPEDVEELTELFKNPSGSASNSSSPSDSENPSASSLSAPTVTN